MTKWHTGRMVSLDHHEKSVDRCFGDALVLSYLPTMLWVRLLTQITFSKASSVWPMLIEWLSVSLMFNCPVSADKLGSLTELTVRSTVTKPQRDSAGPRLRRNCERITVR